MKAWIHGYSGRMGQEILKQMHGDSQWTIIGGSSGRGLYYQEQEGLSWDRFENLVSEANVLIDFSSVSGNADLLRALHTQSNVSTALLQYPPLDAFTIAPMDVATSVLNKVGSTPTTSGHWRHEIRAWYLCCAFLRRVENQKAIQEFAKLSGKTEADTKTHA
ncbi:MAG: hypothetical protein EOP10_29335 [Proteobacteria bacterium]|nr:MAG: hypothetical protein EOP10_29335 [Pseudomonadota bacterium]